METDDVARLFNDSYEKVMYGPAEKNEEFFTAFYKLLITTSGGTGFETPTWREVFSKGVEFMTSRYRRR